MKAEPKTWGLSTDHQGISASLPGETDRDKATGQHYYVPLLRSDYAPWMDHGRSMDPWLLTKADYQEAIEFVVRASQAHEDLLAALKLYVQIDDRRHAGIAPTASDYSEAHQAAIAAIAKVIA